MAENSNGSFQSVGNDTYRVSGVRVNPTTGRYVTGTSSQSAARPSSASSSKTTTRK
jgi:hypothetical protein